MQRLTEEDIMKDVRKIDYQLLGKKTTACILTLYCGFEVIGLSACMSLDWFDNSLGEQFALVDAKHKLWEFVSYKVQDIAFENKCTCEECLIKRGEI